MCFCLEESSLQLNSTRAYITSVDNLDCFDEDVHEMEYYRPCEKAMQAIKATRYLQVPVPDGTFKLRSVTNSSLNMW